MKRGISNWILLALMFFFAFCMLSFVQNTSAADASGVEAFITRFYQLCLDRDPDTAGLEGWANDLLDQVRTGADVAEGFIYSLEFIEKRTTNGRTEATVRP